MTTHRVAAEAVMAWDVRERRRRATAGLERCVDGVMAAGGIILVNAAASLDLGLPEGRAGASLGGALLASGLAWMARKRRAARPAPVGVAVAPVARLRRAA